MDSALSRDEECVVSSTPSSSGYAIHPFCPRHRALRALRPQAQETRLGDLERLGRLRTLEVDPRAPAAACGFFIMFLSPLHIFYNRQNLSDSAASPLLRLTRDSSCSSWIKGPTSYRVMVNSRKVNRRQQQG